MEHQKDCMCHMCLPGAETEYSELQTEEPAPVLPSRLEVPHVRTYSDREVLERMAAKVRGLNMLSTNTEAALAVAYACILSDAFSEAGIDVSQQVAGIGRWDDAHPRPADGTTNTLDLYLQTGVDLVFRIGISAVPIEVVHGRDYSHSVQVFRFKAMSVQQCTEEQQQLFKPQDEVSSFEELAERLKADVAATSSGENEQPATPQYVGVNERQATLDAELPPAFRDPVIPATEPDTEPEITLTTQGRCSFADGSVYGPNPPGVTRTDLVDGNSIVCECVAGFGGMAEDCHYYQKGDGTANG